MNLFSLKKKYLLFLASTLASLDKSKKGLSQAFLKDFFGEKLRRIAWKNKDLLRDLIFANPRRPDKVTFYLVFAGASYLSVNKEYNRHWIPFLKQVRERQSELPQSIQDHFQFLGETHDYWS